MIQMFGPLITWAVLVVQLISADSLIPRRDAIPAVNVSHFYVSTDTHDDADPRLVFNKTDTR
jgi:hypothetical protein